MAFSLGTSKPMVSKVASIISYGPGQWQSRFLVLCVLSCLSGEKYLRANQCVVRFRGYKPELKSQIRIPISNSISNFRSQISDPRSEI